MHIIQQPILGKNGHFRIQICTSVREGTKVQRKIIRSFGVAKTQEDVEHLTRLAKSCLDFEMAKYKKTQLLFDASQSLFDAPIEQKTDTINVSKLKCVEVINEGVNEVYGPLFDNVIGPVLDKKENEIFKHVVLNRISQPSSKRKTRDNLQKNEGINLSLSSIYRMMDKLEMNELNLIDNVFHASQKVLGGKITLLFYDVTTLYFESVAVDEIRNFGYSKDQKFHQTQVVLGLATTENGLPVGYKLFPGNTGETKTLLHCIDEWSKVVKIERVLFVADSAMFNKENLMELSKKGIEFIVSARLKSMGKDIENIVLSEKNREQIQVFQDEEINWVKEINHSIVYDKKKNEVINGRLITRFSPSRAKKDRHDREKILEKLNKKLSSGLKESAKKLVSNSGYLSYTNIDNARVAQISQEKIERSQKWDGVHGIFTNSTKSIKEVFEFYRRLWTIEESFRIQKNDLKMRPIYHFKTSRIKAHIAICYAAFSIIRHLQYKLKENQIKLSIGQVTDILNRVQSTHFKDCHGIKYRLPTEITEQAKSIYSALGIKRKLTAHRI